ncbi:MAG: methionyl-tRNA formyltransferase [Bacteroidales bacterium]
MAKRDRIVFYGTPEFAVASLKALYDEGFNIVGVVTAPDKPAGRGKKLRPSAIKEFALRKQLPVFQPENLKSEAFYKELKTLRPDIQFVVAFRMLPKQVWSLPPKGTVNLHASLLPAYRGAAPINHAIINGEKETGLTTFFINEAIDTGQIIFQTKTQIHPEDNAGMLHDRMMLQGSELITKTAKAIESGKYKTKQQKALYNGVKEKKMAPKLYREDCRIPWCNKKMHQLRNFIRGLSPYPAAHSFLIAPDGYKKQIKIFEIAAIKDKHHYSCGKLLTDGKKYMDITTPDGYIQILELQLSGRKKMTIQEFLRGFPIDETWKIE